MIERESKRERERLRERESEREEVREIVRDWEEKERMLDIPQRKRMCHRRGGINLDINRGMKTAEEKKRQRGRHIDSDIKTWAEKGRNRDREAFT